MGKARCVCETCQDFKERDEEGENVDQGKDGDYLFVKWAGVKRTNRHWALNRVLHTHPQRESVCVCEISCCFTLVRIISQRSKAMGTKKHRKAFVNYSQA